MPWLEVGFGQAPAHHLTRQAVMPGQPHQFTGQQLERPTGAARGRFGTGGGHQQRFFSAREQAGRPRRGSSESARSRLPSTKRRLVRHTVETLTATWRAMACSLSPASAASRICARLSVRADRRATERRVRRARSHSIRRDSVHSRQPPALRGRYEPDRRRVSSILGTQHHG